MEIAYRACFRGIFFACLEARSNLSREIGVIYVKGKVLHAIVLAILLLSSNVQADFGLAATLPKGVRLFSFRLGYISGFTEEFDPNGTLRALDRYNIQMDAKAIQKLSPNSYNLLKSVLDTQSFSNLAPAESLNIGQLNFNGDSDLKIFVPVLGIGLTDGWSIGLAVPIVTHTSNITIGQSGYNNTLDIFGQISSNPGSLSPALAQAEHDLSQGPAYLFNKERVRMGYKEVRPSETQFLGDIVMASRLKLTEKGRWGMYFLQDLNLPTGPEDDPDNLVDLPVFHKLYLDNTLMQNYSLSRKLALAWGLKYRLNLPDQISVRVPEQSGSPLVALDRKERVDRDIADEFSTQLISILTLVQEIKLGAAYEMGFKGSDGFSGDRGYDYSLLSENTDSFWGIMRLKGTYSTVEHYRRRKTGIPFDITYTFSDVIVGKNYERQMSHEILGTLYF